MSKINNQEMAVFLRRCAAGVCDDTCPWASVPTHCEEAMMRHAAELLDPEEVGEDD